MNLSVGTDDIGSSDPLVRAVEKAWDLGIIVVIAAGNNGPDKSTVTSPGISKKVITVGASEENSIISIAGKTFKNYSGRGPTSECIVKPDVLAPGDDIVACLSTNLSKNKLQENYNDKINAHYVKMSGTSMSTPIVTGAIALLLEKEKYLTPNEVKLKIKKSSDDLNFDKNRQGWGIINVNKLLK